MKIRLSPRPLSLLAIIGTLLALTGLPVFAIEEPTLQLESSPKAPHLGTLQSLPGGSKVRISKLQIDSSHAETVDAELQKIDVFAPGAEIIVHGEQGQRRTLPLPDTVYFGGKIVGEDDSQVFLAIDGDGATRQIVHRQGSTAVGERKSPNGHQLGALTARTLDPKTDFAGRAFECGASKPAPGFGARIGALNSSMNYAQMSSATPPTGALTTTQYDVPVVIETDFEYFSRFGNESAARQYIADLFAYINTAYTNEVRATPKLIQVNIYTTSSDPWSASTADSALNQLQQIWGTRSMPVRAAVHFISGKPLSIDGYGASGMAHLGALCDNTWGYGVSGGISGNFSPAYPALIWDTLVVAHELGHNFGSLHTHNFDDPYNARNWDNGISSPVDCCFDPSLSDGVTGQCSYRTRSLPGVGSLSGGTAGIGAGTIMSYCHLLSPGDSNISLTFGASHPYGIAAWRVPNAMRRHVEQAQASYPNCITPSSGTPTSHTLSVSTSGTGSGTVSSNPAGISCGSDCSESYTNGTSVTLSATPASGSTFAGWSGACSGTGGCTVSMSAARSVTATFNKMVSTHTLNISKNGTGSGTVTSSPAGISCGSDCTENYNSGTLVTLTATPDSGGFVIGSGSTFAGWSGACSGTGNCTVSMTAARSVTATFHRETTQGETPLSNGVPISIAGNQGVWRYFSINVPPAASNLTIQTDGGSGDLDLYVRYASQPTLNVYDCVSDSPGNREGCRNSTPQWGTYHIGVYGYTSYASATLTASFSTSHTLNVSKVGTGSGTVTSTPGGINCGSDCSENYTSGTTVTLTATPTSNSAFVGWSGACSGTGSCTVSMTETRYVTANFSTPQSVSHTLFVGTNGDGGGLVTSNPTGIHCGSDCNETYPSGTKITLTASPSSGSTFAGWGRACSGTGSCTVTMDAVKWVTATFFSGAPVNNTKLPLNTSVSNSVAQGKWANYHVQSKVPGTVVVSLRNLGDDIDLYVRKGSLPDLNHFDCVSGNEGTNNEQCRIQVNAEETVQIGVHGYSASSYNLQTAFLIADSSPHSSKIQQYYVAYYGRPGDLGGIEYWVDQLAAGADDQAMIPAFGSTDQAEFVATYGSNPTNGDFLDKAYQNILGRQPDKQGRAFWAQKINDLIADGKSPDAARAQIVIDLVYGISGANDKALFDNKTYLAKHTSTRTLSMPPNQASSLIVFVRDVIFKRANLGDASALSQAIADINAFAP